MIHDVILTCLSLSQKGISIKNFLSSNVVDTFMHPCERQIFKNILEILNYLNEVVRFAKYFGGINSNDVVDFEEANEYSSGYYLKNFAKGIESALDDYYNEVARLEVYYKKKKANSLLYVYTALEAQLPIILFLRKLIGDARIQKLHGCGLLQNVYQQYEQGILHMDVILIKVLKPIKMVFYSHLAHWLLLGMIDDQHNEFFITFKQSSENAAKNSSNRSQTSSSYLSSVSEEDIWQYEVNITQLPRFVSIALAEKILFIGQTVLVFKMDRSKQRNENSWDMKAQGTFGVDVSELWDGKEAVFSKLIEDLNDDDKLDEHRFEQVINEIKKYVSQRLSDIAVIEDDLYRQMGFVKDFYLLGRGEFYLEFLRQLHGSSEDNSETNVKNFTRAFEIASNVMGIVEELENFTLSVQKSPINLEESYEFGIWQNLHLKYIHKWPLNLLFSPVMVERYNNVFRFLLIVRKLQYDLQLVWARHKWVAKMGNPVHIRIMNFRNHLSFFLDNLQYYIHVDVLESQHSILIDFIRSKADFEEIQRAHSTFLANVMSQCFLLNDAVDKKANITQVDQLQNPIYGTILDIFNICEKFSFFDSMDSTPEDALKEIEILEERFNVSMIGLIKLMADIKSASSFGPLSQLLLRLDYNRWFSANKTANEKALIKEFETLKVADV